MPTYRVDNIPLLLRPAFLLLSHGAALALFLYTRLVRATSRVAFTGGRELARGHFIFCHWHTFIGLYFVVFSRHARHAWMQHPYWFMKPIHFLLRLSGVEIIVLGSSGHEGRQAADELARLLAEGYSTVVLPDGPAGPPFVMRKGVVHMAMQSGVPVVPIRFTASRTLALPTWDRKLLPLPFGRIEVELGPPLQLRGMELEEAAQALARALGPPP